MPGALTLSIAETTRERMKRPRIASDSTRRGATTINTLRIGEMDLEWIKALSLSADPPGYSVVVFPRLHTQPRDDTPDRSQARRVKRPCPLSISTKYTMKTCRRG